MTVTVKVSPLMARTEDKKNFGTSTDTNSYLPTKTAGFFQNAELDVVIPGAGKTNSWVKFYYARFLYRSRRFYCKSFVSIEFELTALKEEVISYKT